MEYRNIPPKPIPPTPPGKYENELSVTMNWNSLRLWFNGELTQYTISKVFDALKKSAIKTFAKEYPNNNR